MKFLLASYGSRGDVEPFAAIGRELLRRGHDVCMAVPPNMVGLAESAGLAAGGYGPDSQVLRDQSFVRNFWKNQNPISAVGEIMQHVTQVWAAWATTLTPLAKGADLLLTGTSEQGVAANVAEYYGIPLAALHFFPGGHSRVGGWIGRITEQAEDAQRRALGLPQATGPQQRGTLDRGSLEIQAYDEFCFPGLAAEWGEQAMRRPFVGALTLELPTEADEEVLSWIAAGTPPIYFGFGSSVRVASAVDTVAMIGMACAQLGHRALICTGASDFTKIPRLENVKLVSAVNHSAVFPACRAAVHHGGAGTTAAVMRAGIPMLILWLWLDHPIWAAVAERLKVGLGRQFSRTSVESLITDLRLILTPQYVARAHEVATEVTQPAESVARAADLLEDAARRGRAD